MVVDSLNFVPLGIQEKSRIVLRVIVSQARRTRIAPTRSQSSRVKGFDLVFRLRTETPVASCVRYCVQRLIDAEVGVSVIVRTVSLAKADRVISFRDYRGAECREDCGVETLGTCNVLNGDRNVIK